MATNNIHTDVEMSGTLNGVSANTAASRSSGPTDASHQSGHQRVTHAPSGYTYEREEDAPGYSWSNKKAQEEEARARDNIVDPDASVGKRLPDAALIAPEGTPWQDIK